MFNLQGSEIVIVLLLALVVLGPEKLPDAIRKVGQFYAELKKMSSGFQSEFRAAVDEPMREMRDTASLLRDSADFTKLQDGARDEKPKSAEMSAVEPGEAGSAQVDPPEAMATTAVDGAADEPRLAADSKPAPFSGESSTAPRRSEPAPGPDGDDATDDAAAGPVAAPDSKPAPFAGRSSAAPRPTPLAASDEDGAVGADVPEDLEVADDAEDLEHAGESTAGVPPSGADDGSGHRR